MDVVGLSKNGIANVVANLGTSLTDKQILTLNQFFDDIIICFDGDESGYKAALRAAENTIKELRPEKQLSFLFLPNNEDPDSYVNKYGKNYFVDFTKQSKLTIHQFIFSHYKKCYFFHEIFKNMTFHFWSPKPVGWVDGGRCFRQSS